MNRTAFMYGFLPMFAATMIGSVAGALTGASLAPVFGFAAWGLLWALIVGMVAARGRWARPSLLPLLALVPVYMDLFTGLPVPAWTGAPILIAVVLAESRTRAIQRPQRSA